MRVDIGGYPKEIMVDVIEEILQRYGIPEKLIQWGLPKLQTLIDIFWNTWINDRYIEVKIHKHDIINMDHTLGEIILPMLKKYKKEAMDSNTYFLVDDDDVPLYMHVNAHDIRCEYVLDKIIMAFKLHLSRDTWEASYYSSGDMHGLAEENEQIQFGLRLFGKHYGDLWL